MLFSSPIFLYLFLPVTIFTYFLCPRKYRNLLLLLASVFFYSWGEEFLVLLLLGVTAVNYFCGRLIDRGYRKTGLYLSLAVSLGNLLVFKYANFTLDNLALLLDAVGLNMNVKIPQIALPLGISFYTFQALSYTIDVYRGQVKATRSFIDFATYITLFPQLVAGPIVRYADIHRQLLRRRETVDKFVLGISRFILGLAKKMFIANPCGFVADEVFSFPVENVSTPLAWIGIVFYAFQIYFDFSAYSDMAIGLGRIFGFKFLENFNYPYISASIKEFWRRWHISLSTWFRDYLYIPLGGSRVSKARTYLNLFIVFFVTGLWHGASWNFIVWGLFHGCFLVLERVGLSRILDKVWSPVAHIYTLLVVLIGWVFFRADNLTVAVDYIGVMFGFADPANAIVDASHFCTATNLVTLAMAVLFSFPVFRVVEKRVLARFRSVWVKVAAALFLLALLFLCMIYVGAGSYSPFIYFRF